MAIGAAVWRRDRRIGGTLLATALAFRIFIWLLPCTLLICALLGFSVSGKSSVGSLSGRAGLSPLTANLLDQVANQARGGRSVTAALGLVLLAFSGAGLARAMDGVRIRVWGPFERRGIRPAVIRAAAYSGLLLSVIVFNAGVGLLRASTGLPGVLMSLAAVALFVVVGVFMLASGLPYWRAALPGAVVFALGIELLRLLSTYYLPVRLERATQLYGALGMAAAVLIWLTLLARLIVFGHVLNAVLWQHKTDRDHPPARPVQRGTDGGPADNNPGQPRRGSGRQYRRQRARGGHGARSAGGEHPTDGEYLVSAPGPSAELCRWGGTSWPRVR